MKRIAVIALLATMLAGFLVFVPSTQTTHAAANCAKRDGVGWRVAIPGSSSTISLGTIDVWSCLAQANSGDPNNDFSYAYVSFRIKNIKVTACTVNISDLDNNNLVSRDCTQDAQNHTVGAHYWGSRVEASNGYAASRAKLWIRGYVSAADQYIEMAIIQDVELYT